MDAFDNLSGGADRKADLLNDDDWRVGGGAAAAKPRAVRTARARATTAPGSPAEERERAAEVVAATKGIIAATFNDIRFGRRIDTAMLQPVVEQIAASVERSPMALPGVTRLKQRHEYTYLHSIAVCGLMIGLASDLGLDPALTQEIGLAGLLHDVGKARVPLALLDKAGPLDLAEYALVQEHTRRGHDLLVESGIDSPITLDVCMHHHERIDGQGYPTGISAQTISIHARMAAVCDVYDAVTSSRSYKDRWSPGAALAWMAETQGQFDPRVLRVFRRMIGIFPIGSLVRLESQRLGVVLDDPGDDPATPPVGVFQCASTRRPLPLARIDSRHDRIISIEAPERWGVDDWTVREPQLVAAFAEAAAE